jgi:hypothetical protein
VLHQPVQQGELLVVRECGEAAALDGEDLERGEADTVEAGRGPAVAPVRVGERRGVDGAFTLPGQQVVHVDAPPGAPSSAASAPGNTAPAAAPTAAY